MTEMHTEDLPLISIIVPVYNVERYLERCISSLLEQTFKNIEIILVNDGSTDNSGKLCDDYTKIDNRIKVIHKENAGLGMARNSGLDIAKGKYVTFIDSDDYIGKNHIQSMYNKIVTTATDTCIGGYTKEFSDRKVEHINVCEGSVFKDKPYKEILPRMCGADQNGNDYIEMSVCMVLFSNKIIQENGLRFLSEREYISEDLVFDFGYYPLSKGVCVSDNVDYYYCDNMDSLTTKYKENRFEQQIKLYNYLMNKSEDMEIKKECKVRLQNTTIAIARYCIKLEWKFSKENGVSITNKRIKEICNNNILQEMFADYDDSEIKITSRFVNYLIKHKMYLGLKYVMKLKNYYNI